MLLSRIPRIKSACFFLLFTLLFSLTFAQENSFPVSIQSSISDPLDDVEENQAGEIYSTSSDLELVNDGGEQTVGLRFNNINLPQGVQIDRAYIQFSVDESSSSFCQVELRTEQIDNAAAFEEINQNVTNRDFSGAAVVWQISPWNSEFEQGAAQRSPDLKDIIQEIVDRSGWQGGNSIVVGITGSGTRTAISYNRDPDFAPVLHIEAQIPLPNTPINDLYINELMASSTRVLDDQGEPEDWVEIYNAGSESQNLAGLYLSDDPADLQKWRILAPIEIPSGGFGILWLDGETEQGNDHGPFKLDKEGEDLILVQVLDDQEIVLDQIAFPELEQNVSYGRETDGGASWIKFSEYSPKESNNGKGQYLAAKVSFSLDGGFYANSVDVSMTSSDPDTDIYYTLDGSEPGTGDILYTGTINIAETRLLRARAFKTGFAGGETKAETYFINENHSLAVLDIQTEPENLFDNEIGIYVRGTNGIDGFCNFEPRNWNRSWERPIRLSMYESNGTQAFSVNAGIKIGGGCSRGSKMKPLNFYFRKNLYGDGKVEYPVFPQLDVEEYNRLKVRNSGNDFEQMGFRDGAIQSMLYKTIDLDIMAYRPVIAYINGTYWGLYGLRELYNEDYIASHHDVDPDNLDIISNPYAGGEIHEGDRVAFEQIQNYIDNNDLSIPANYEFVKSQVDINEFLNYHIVQIYLANYDWPANNLRVWRERKAGAKWRWMLFDLDATSGFAAWSQSTVTHNTLDFATTTNGDWWPNGPHSTLWLRKLLENEEFRNEFVQRTSTYAELVFNTDRVNHITDSIQAMISPEIDRHQARWTNNYWEWGWGQPAGGSRQSWQGYIQTFKEFFRRRLSVMLSHTRFKFGLSGARSLRFNHTNNKGGKVFLHDNETEIPPQFSSQYFVDIPLKVKAVANPGYVFLKWEETGDSNPEIEFMSDGYETLTPVFVPLQPSITEIHYNPEEGQQYEFLEIHNPGDNELDLGGYRFEEGIEFTFPENTRLGSEEFLILAKDKGLYASIDCQVLQWDAGELANEGEILSLAMPSGEIIDRVIYSSGTPWPVEANGGGSSLSLIKAYLDNSVVENWEAYFAQGGSPCGQSSPVLNGGLADNFSVKLYPNPAKDELNIEYSSISVDPLKVEVFNLMGQKVAVYELAPSPFQRKEVISLSDISPGTYVFSFGDESMGLEQKMVIVQE
ncbi:MAG: CotH kinase family protein [Bacteroidia bacterium]|nr:CotH kinase family protein [Bacteroidia bacterium]